MSTNSQEQEIDLGQIGQKISKSLRNIGNTFFDFLFFIQRKWLILFILFVSGIALAFLTDGKVYTHEVSVIPNFGSNEYLYKKIDQIDTKLREKDKEFFNKMGVKNFDKILEVKISAFPAIYNFVNTRDQQNNFELVKLMAEDGDIDKILKDEITSKNYYHHKIEIKTKGMFSKEDFIHPLLKSLNDNTFFETQKKIHLQNLKEKVALNDSLLKQIDQLIYQLSSSNTSGTISISEKNSIPELVEKKDKLIQETQYLRTNESIYDSIIKEENSIINIRNYKPLFLNNKIVFPFLLIVLYFLGYNFIIAYKKQKARLHS